MLAALKSKLRLLVVFALPILVASAWIERSLHAQANYDEANVPKYQLPDPLTMQNGRKVTDASMWQSQRRPEVLGLFEEFMYGKAPAPPQEVTVKLLETSDHALGGKAIRKQVRIGLGTAAGGANLDLLIYLPKQAKRPVPCFLGLNFGGNHTTSDDPKILLSEQWIPNRMPGVENNQATDKARGAAKSRWPFEALIDRGYAVATMYCGDIDPDMDDQFENGVHALYSKPNTARPPEAWGTISAWAWGLSRALDYLETDDDIDQKHVAVLGHSRLGKTSLWAGATDPRFALVISNNSGCGGAALSRRAYGETVARINTSFPHWFNDNFVKYNGNENELPIDQHELIALVAPRPVLVASAEGDQWADPRGEFLSCLNANGVYRLLGTSGLPTDEMPEVDAPVLSGTIGYYIRAGKHDITLADWMRFADFADRHFKK